MKPLYQLKSFVMNNAKENLEEFEVIKYTDKTDGSTFTMNKAKPNHINIL